jgi:hypothetical protein
MIAFLEERAEPDDDQGSHGRALPVSVRQDVGIEGVGDAHILQNAKEQRQTVDLLVYNRKRRCGHATSYLKGRKTRTAVCANDKVVQNQAAWTKAN